MAEKSIKARIVQKHDTEANWLKATNFTPKQGEVIIYDIDSTHSIERFKIGDGTTNVNELPFQDTNISNFKSGSEILIDDISPVTHEMGVKVRGKNLLPYPYFDSSKSSVGATITVNEDRSISFSGTPTSYIGFILYKGNALVKSGTFTISVGNLTNISTTLFIYDGSGATLKTYSFTKSVTVNADDYPMAATWNITMARAASNQQINGTVYPQIELGTTATAYTPYVPDLTAVKVSRCGKNLLSEMSLFPTVTNNAVPIHFKAGQKYTISFTTTYTAWRLMFLGTDKNGTAFDNSSPDANKYISGMYTGTTGRLQHASNLSGNTFTFTCNEDCIITAIVFWNVSNETDKTYSDFQLEFGTTPTDYEPYKECAEYTPTTDGTVNGVTSLYPTTTLMTDTEGIIINCEYLTNNYKSVLDNRTSKDWQQNDETASDYIKNRPGGYDALIEILPETTFSGGGATLDMALVLGDTYKVTFDGVEYVSTAKQDDNYPIFIGNTTYTWHGTITDDPFCISFQDVNSCNINCDSGDHTVKVDKGNIVKIDEKYLDIKNNNIVNGSKSYSLRTTGSSKEDSSYTIGLGAFAEGYFTQASGEYSHAEGYGSTVSGNISHAEGKSTNVSGPCSHAEGQGTHANGWASHAEGYNTYANQERSHAEGSETYADGIISHAEGDSTHAVGWASHTEGYNTIVVASANAAHAEGSDTIASSNYQHVQGIYNIEDSSNVYADIIGNGYVDDKGVNRSNAHTVDWRGNAWYAGDVYVGSTSGTNKDEGSKKLATEDYVNSAISSSGGSGIVVDTALSSTSENPVQNKVINTALGTKVDKVSGKGLSTNDYTTAEKNKLAGIEAGANKTVVDTALSDTSENPVQNKVINTALSNKMDKINPTGTGSFSLNRKSGTTTGDYSFAEGRNTTAEGMASHAEGWNTLTGHRGFEVTACKKLTATTGTYTLTSVTGLEVNQHYSVQLSRPKENCGKITAIDTTNKKITVDGYPNISLRPNGSSTANSLTIVGRPTLGDIVVSGDAAHVEGDSTQALGDYSHAEGFVTTASGHASHAEGASTKASGDYSHAEGGDTIASGDHQHVQGKYNKEDTVNTYADIIGNGYVDNEGEIIRSNAATVDWVGYAWYAGAVSSKSADYAEFFEWLDGNPNNEDRVGYLVTLDGEKIRFANPEDEIHGIISANPAILGDNYECDWNGKYLTDEFGRILYDKVEEFIDIPKVDEETGETIVEKKSLGFFDHPRINPDYDPDQEYINRRNRSEWAMVGMLGKLFVRDDGTAQINGYVSAGEGGIATASTEKTNMRVLSRVNDHIVKVLLK